MRVLLLGEYPLDERKFSIGPERVISIFLQEFMKFPELDIHLVTMRKEVKKDKIMKKGNITLHYLSFPSPKVVTNLLRGTIKLVFYIRNLSPDIIHSHGDPKYSLPPSLSFFPWVHTIHGITYEEAKLWRGKRRFQRLFYPYLEKRALKKCHHIIAISNHIKEKYSFLGNTKFHSLPNPVDREFFEIKTPPAEERILFLGSISYLKSPLTLVKSLLLLIEKFPSLQVHLAGKVKETHYFAQITRFIRKKKITESIKYLGLLSREKVLKEMEEASILVLPSHQETFPMSIAEAMAAGRPVVATRVGGIPEMIEEGKTGFLIESEDWRGLAEKISLLLRNESLRREMGKKSREKALKLYYPEIVARKTIEIYEKVINEFYLT